MKLEPLSKVMRAHFTGVLVTHADDLITGVCPVCLVSRCSAGRRAYRRLTGWQASGSTTYYAANFFGQFHEAADELYDHLVAGVDGHCITCGELEPCPRRVYLSALFARHQWLPIRQPGRALKLQEATHWLYAA